MRGSPFSPVARLQADVLIGRPASLASAREFEQAIMELYRAEYMVGGT
jgi:hypothetical protein